MHSARNVSVRQERPEPTRKCLDQHADKRQRSRPLPELLGDELRAAEHPDGPWRAWDLDRFFGQDIHLTEALTLEAQPEIRYAVSAKRRSSAILATIPHTPIKPDNGLPRTIEPPIG